eukprot:m.105354 g.105354  ORF g.105354 m.105354 type:complete len:250 (-) comp21009_c0_seq1:168-917(-)
MAAAMEVQKRKRKFGEGEPLRNRLTLGDKETTKTNKLMEDLFSLAHAKEAGDKDVLLQRLQHSIAALEQTLDKPMHAVRMNAREKASYQDKRESIDLKIEASKQEVVAAKLTLVDAQAKRRRQEAYDELAAVALELPSREVSTTSITELKADLERVQAETDALDSKFELRKRQFKLLIYKVHDIRSILKADGELEDEEEDVAAGAEAEAEAVPDCETTVESNQSNAADDRRPAMYGGAAASDGKQPPRG